MIIELVDKLIDKCIQLLQSRKQRRTDLLQNFVEPAFVQFEIVHKEYLASFKRYRDASICSDCSMEDIADAIANDNRFLESQREKLRLLTEIPVKSELDCFVRSILQYLKCPHYSPLQFSQRWEAMLVLERGLFLSIKRDKNKNARNRAVLREYRALKAERRKELVKTLDRIVVEMQTSYAEVAKQYTRLRTVLLH